MKDFFGTDLKIGDKIALNVPGHKNLSHGTIIGFTPKMVKIEYIDYSIQSSHINRFIFF